ncbi:MAG: hypothetical protein Q9218_006312 [Villophora microphyllina]
MAVVGLLMFGKTVRDEITSNILLTKGFPQALSITMVVFIAIIPITKIPLNSRPISINLKPAHTEDSNSVSCMPL